MRSQDLWLGFGYDIFAATVLHELMAGWLDVEPGEYHLHVDSLHLYTEHLTLAKSIGSVKPSPVMPMLATGWDGFDPLLSEVVTGGYVDHPGWREFAEVMRAYRTWKNGDHATARRVAQQTAGPMARALDSWFDRLTAGRSA